MNVSIKFFIFIFEKINFLHQQLLFFNDKQIQNVYPFTLISKLFHMQDDNVVWETTPFRWKENKKGKAWETYNSIRMTLKTLKTVGKKYISIWNKWNYRCQFIWEWWIFVWLCWLNKRSLLNQVELRVFLVFEMVYKVMEYSKCF